MDEFSMLELDEIMRQKEDGEFAQLLCRVRTAVSTEEDIKKLQSRSISVDDTNYPGDALHVYRLNKDVDEQNKNILNQLTPVDQQVTIKAIDRTKDTHTSQLDVAMPKSKANTGGLISELCLAVGAKVMLTVNVDVSDGLVNGARGTVADIIKTSGNVSLVLVNFNNSRVGVTAIQKSHYRQQHPHAVPISRREATFRIGWNKTAEVSRTQFPLVLSWATTIHKVQGLTLDKIVVDMKGGRFTAGQAYVAFSRVKSLNTLFIKNFDSKSIKTSQPAVAEMERLSSNCLTEEPAPQVLSLSGQEWIKIGHLKVHSYIAKEEDVLRDQCVQSTDIMCFTETFLTSQHTLSTLTLNNQSAHVFRLDRIPTTAQDLGKGGIMIACAEALHPQEVNIHHHVQLEVKTISVTHLPMSKMYVMTVYRRPRLPSIIFLGHFDNYLTLFPYEQFPTVILSDFNDNK